MISLYLVHCNDKSCVNGNISTYSIEMSFFVQWQIFLSFLCSSWLQKHRLVIWSIRGIHFRKLNSLPSYKITLYLRLPRNIKRRRPTCNSHLINIRNIHLIDIRVAKYIHVWIINLKGGGHCYCCGVFFLWKLE